MQAVLRFLPFFSSEEQSLLLSCWKAAAYLRALLKCYQPSYLNRLGIYKHILISDAYASLWFMIHWKSFSRPMNFLKKVGQAGGGVRKKHTVVAHRWVRKVSFFLCWKNVLDSIIFLFHIRVKPRYLETIWKMHVKILTRGINRYRET